MKKVIVGMLAGVFVVLTGCVVEPLDRVVFLSQVDDRSARMVFYEILRSEIDKYGISNDPREDGVVSVSFVDFNNDGLPELIFSRRFDGGSGVYYFVYGYAENAAQLLFEGIATPFSTGPTSFHVVLSNNGEKFLAQTTSHQWSFTAYYYSFADGESVVALSRYILRSMEPGEDDKEIVIENHYVNGENVSEEIYLNSVLTELGVPLNIIYLIPYGNAYEKFETLSAVE